MAPTREMIEQAAAALRAGRLVAFPTETVYGLGADASNRVAVGRIFEVKHRPATHPLIVHLASSDELERWAVDVPELAWTLAARFWPGPLTLVLRRSSQVPSEVTGGLETVALRVPDHPVADELLRAFGGGIAAPSANRFGSVSPTRAEHVRQDLGSSVDVILDGGPCEVGIESTIVDLSGGEPAILRPGGVTPEDLESVAGAPVPVRSEGAVRAPGQMPSHYAPEAAVILLRPEEVEDRLRTLYRQGARVGVITTEPTTAGRGDTVVISGDEAELSRQLYAALRDFDRRGCDVVLATLPPERGLGLAIADRLRRAAGPRPDPEDG